MAPEGMPPRASRQLATGVGRPLSTRLKMPWQPNCPLPWPRAAPCRPWLGAGLLGLQPPVPSWAAASRRAEGQSLALQELSWQPPQSLCGHSCVQSGQHGGCQGTGTGAPWAPGSCSPVWGLQEGTSPESGISERVPVTHPGHFPSPPTQALRRLLPVQPSWHHQPKGPLPSQPSGSVLGAGTGLSVRADGTAALACVARTQESGTATQRPPPS